MRSPHRAVDFRKRRPRVTVELDLYAERTSKTAPFHGVEDRFEVDVALADRGKIPDAPFTVLVLQVAMDQFRQSNLQIGDGIDAVRSGDATRVVLDLAGTA